MAEALEKIIDVEIDPEGTFKYILVRVTVKDGGVHKDIVRGTKSAEYHSKFAANNQRLQARNFRSRISKMQNPVFWRQRRMR